MSGIRLIQVVLSTPETGETTLQTALVLARNFKAHIRALHVMPDSALSIPLVGEAMLGSLVEDTMRTCEEHGTQRRDALKALFEQWAHDQKIAVMKEPCAESHATASWYEVVGVEDTIAATAGRLCDLSVISLPPEDKDDPWLEATLNTVLMESGRPLLVPPRTAPSHIGTRIAIAWNGSQEAARAMAAALPLLQQAETVTVLAMQEEESPPLHSPVPWLTCHGVNARTHQLEPLDITGDKIGETLLRAVSSCQANLLVMGTFGHSRLRQMILGVLPDTFLTMQRFLCLCATRVHTHHHCNVYATVPKPLVENSVPCGSGVGAAQTPAVVISMVCEDDLGRCGDVHPLGNGGDCFPVTPYGT